MREIIVNFHGVGVAPPQTESSERLYWWDEDAFIEALSVLSKRPRHAVSITFDDGNKSDLTIALPALVRRGMTAAFFVCAGRIGAPGYLDRAGIRDLLSAGMRVGSHGMHHRDWRKLNSVQLDEEIVSARRVLQELCGQEIEAASIPFGSYDRRVLSKLRAEGYRRVFTSDGGAAEHNSWLTPRNTLDRSWQRKDMLVEIEARDTLARRLRRAIVCRYKAAR